MFKHVTLTMLTLLLMISSVSAYESLQLVYDQAGGNGDYDKYIELDPETEYLGDLIINTGLNTYIHGHGAIIYGLTGNQAILVFASNLDLSHCIIIGGQNGIDYDTLSSGLIHNNTVVNCDSIGITVYYHDYNQGVEVWDNIVVGGMYGFIRLEEWPTNYLGHNTIYDTEICRYGDYCPTWGEGEVTPFYPGQGDQDENPLFTDPNNNDYSLQAASPCIGSGRYGGDRGAILSTTGLQDDLNTPVAFRLRGNYPNPFNASTTIKYDLPITSEVKIDIYDIIGRKVETLIDKQQTAGHHQAIWHADDFSSGMYFYKIQAGDYTETKKMVLLK